MSYSRSDKKKRPADIVRVGQQHLTGRQVLGRIEQLLRTVEGQQAEIRRLLQMYLYDRRQAQDGHNDPSEQ